MKKITLLIALAISAFTYAQTTCNTAVALNLTGTTTVASFGTEVATPDCNQFGTATGTAWYTFTPTSDGILNLNSDLAQNGAKDTTVNLYSGNCFTLTCEGNADDVSYPSNLSTNGNFNVTGGTTYYIAWDDRWSSAATPTAPFDFTASFTAVTAAPNAVTMPSPADMATGVDVDPADGNMDNTADNGVLLSWTPDATGSPATEYNIFYGSSATMLNNLTANTTYTGTSVTITGNEYNTTNFWQIEAINGAGSTLSPVWQFTTEVPSATAPSNASNPTPIDGAVNVMIDPADNDGDGTPDNAVDISWTQDAIGQQPTAYTIRLGDSATTLVDLTTTFIGTGARFLNQMPGTTYFWQIVPTNDGSEAINQPIWSYTTEGTASIDDNAVSFFTVSPNPASSFIELSSDVELSNVRIYNALGQTLSSNMELVNNRLDVTSLRAGMYFINASSDTGSQTIQFIKN